MGITKSQASARRLPPAAAAATAVAAVAVAVHVLAVALAAPPAALMRCLSWRERCQLPSPFFRCPMRASHHNTAAAARRVDSAHCPAISHSLRCLAFHSVMLSWPDPLPPSRHPVRAPQIGFFDIVALPLFQSFAQALPQATPMLDAVKDNYNMWKDEMMAAAQGEQH